MVRCKVFALVISIGLVVSVFLPVAKAQDLSGLAFCIDPGHGAGSTNLGPTGLNEADINLWVAHFLRDYLRQAHIDTVILTHEDNTTNPTLSQREDIANSNNVDWFHSIHHNAYNGRLRYTLVLYEELAGHVPQWPGQADTMSYIMARTLYQALRTSDYYVYGDYTFYGRPSYLGVLNELMMPGELSEATFHDNRIEEAKLKNKDFDKMEARALFVSFLDYYEAGTLPNGALAGIIYDFDTLEPVDGARCEINPGGIIYVTDNHHNGLYIADSLAPGTYTVSVSKAGYRDTLATVNVRAHAFDFLDFYLVSETPPVVVTTWPEPGDTLVQIYSDIRIEFSRCMDRASVEAHFSITPSVSGHFEWSNRDKKLRFVPDELLAYNTLYEVVISGKARGKFGHPLDGNGDGIGGDAFHLVLEPSPGKPASLWP